MLSQENRLHRSSDFRRVVRTGVKVNYGRVVVYAARQDSDKELAVVVARSAPHTQTPGTPPRVGLIVSKAVGNAVVRHQLSRRLRHTCRELLPSMPSGIDIVIRALPGTQLAPSRCLENWLAECLCTIAAKPALRAHPATAASH